MRTSTVELITFVIHDFDTLSMPLLNDFSISGHFGNSYATSWSYEANQYQHSFGNQRYLELTRPLVFYGPIGKTIWSELLIEFAVTCISAHVSLLGVSESLQGSASSISGIGRRPHLNFQTTSGICELLSEPLQFSFRFSETRAGATPHPR